MTIINEQEIATKPQEGESDIVLSVHGVSKKFCRDLKRSLMYGVQDISSELLGLREKSDKLRKKEFWALDNVSFQLRKGEALGLVGKNGSGKSTLLRIIAGLIKPDTGFVEVNGRVAPLIALGAGFNPILTGRENIYANMAILGLSKQEIDERFDAVIDFAEIEDAIDAPVQSYSSGMRARLGFASAIYTEPDILLVDEVLAVGDVRFQEKCRRQLYELRQKGTTFVLVSHQTQVVLETCPKAIYLSRGKLITSGDTASVMNQYEEDLFLQKDKPNLGGIFKYQKKATETQGLDIVSIFFRNAQQEIIETPVSGDLTYFCVECKAHKKIDNVGLILAVHASSGVSNSGPIFVLSSFNDGQSFDILPGNHEIQMQMPYLGLKIGLYTTRIYIRKDSIFTLDFTDSFKFEVKAKDMMSRCLFYQPRSWNIIDK